VSKLFSDGGKKGGRGKGRVRAQKGEKGGGVYRSRKATRANPKEETATQIAGMPDIREGENPSSLLEIEGFLSSWEEQSSFHS